MWVGVESGSLLCISRGYLLVVGLGSRVGGFGGGFVVV